MYLTKNQNRLVLKIGGSVLTNELAYQEQAIKIRDILETENFETIYVVVSAQKGETDRLIKASGNSNVLRRALRGEPFSWLFS